MHNATNHVALGPCSVWILALLGLERSFLFLQLRLCRPVFFALFLSHNILINGAADRPCRGVGTVAADGRGHAMFLESSYLSGLGLFTTCWSVVQLTGHAEALKQSLLMDAAIQAAANAAQSETELSDHADGPARKKRGPTWQGKPDVIERINELIEELDDIESNISLQVCLLCLSNSPPTHCSILPGCRCLPSLTVTAYLECPHQISSVCVLMPCEQVHRRPHFSVRRPGHGLQWL